MSSLTGPTATTPPRCLHRVAMVRWLTILLVSLLGPTTATVSLFGQETSLLDYRFVDPAGHMQPWPVEEAELFLAPEVTARIATKWRTNLTGQRRDQLRENPPQPGPTLETAKASTKNDDAEPTDDNVEVLVVPQTLENLSPPAAQQPANQPSDCYQAPALSSLSINIALPAGELPTNASAVCAAQTPPTGDRRVVGGWAITEHHWSATCSRHKPLFFEDINAERYGYTASYCLQPLFSAARFFATIPALPYKMAVDRPRECVYTLGHYRPGSCAPKRPNFIPWQVGAAVVETGFVAALILLIP